MSPAPYDPFRLPVRTLGCSGLLGLALLTLVEDGATRMYSTPWTWVLAGTLATPVLLLIARLSSGIPVRLPTTPWLTLTAIAGVMPVVSAMLSPYRAQSLWSAAIPLSAGCLFLLIHDWIRADETHRRSRLAGVLAGVATLLALVSTIQWLVGIVSLDRKELLSSAVFMMRNTHPLGHANYTAGLMLIGLPWLAYAIGRNRGLMRGVFAAGAALTLLNLFMSGSRGGLLGLAAMGVFGVAMARPGWKRFSVIAGSTLLLVGLLAVANPRIRSLLQPANPAAEPRLSTVQRTAMLQAGAHMGADRPLLGWGPGTTPLVYPRYRQHLDGGVENALQLHSTPVQLWAETGAAGLVGALLLLGLVGVAWRRSPVAATTFAGYGVFALTDYQLDVPFFAAAMAVLCALLATPSPASTTTPARMSMGLSAAFAASLIVALGARDRAPLLNAEALRLAQDPAQHSRAVTAFNESLALNPDQEIAHFNLGWLLLVPDPAQAEQHFVRAARLVPDKGGVYFGIGLARMNQGRPDGAAHAFALECVNEPRFLASPWWTVPEIAAHRTAAAAMFSDLLDRARRALPDGTWAANQARLLRGLAAQLGQVSPGPEAAYRRERIGYPVLMRNLDLAPPQDLYDVREDPRFPASAPFPLPTKGWLPSPLLLKLLDEPARAPH